MSDVIFKEQTTTHGETKNEFVTPNTKPETNEISKKWLEAVQRFTDEIQGQVFQKIKEYSESTEVSHSHPTTHELVQYMDLSKATVQPRTSELKDAQVIEVAGKRPCTCSDCRYARDEKGKKEISVTTWQIRQVTE